MIQAIFIKKNLIHYLFLFFNIEHRLFRILIKFSFVAAFVKFLKVKDEK
jgi:hypothetical protein